jgi:magnesium chelatase family protein
MLAKRLITLMPEMTFDEILQTSKIYSVCGKLGKKPLITHRPFRNPHHTISKAGLVGGGPFPQPGEISLAHNGILFLDEFTEFKRDVLEVLRQPLEHQTVSIARVQQTITFPASFLLVAAMNPCPCGFLADKKRECKCTSAQIARYINKLSGPLLDRIDLQVSVPSVDYETINQNDQLNISSEILYEKIEKAIEIQSKRNEEFTWNAHMTPTMIEQHCKLTEKANILVKKAFEKLNLTMRGYHKLLKVARTVADLDQSELIDEQHIKETLLYRSIDKTVEQKNL